jgi:hypothetical protein
MMTMIKRTLFIVVLIVLTSAVHSQEKDFGIWYCLNAEIGLIKHLNLDLSGQIRTFKGASRIDESYGEIGLTYKITKNVGVAGAYRLTDKLESDSKYHPVHKWFTDIKGGGNIGNFSLSGRFRFQIQKKTFMKNAEDSIPYYHGRLKLSSKYKFRSSPVDPYISYEIFWPMFKPTENHIDKKRLTIGLEFKMIKKRSFDLEYIYQRDYRPHLLDSNIIALVYNFKIKGN